MVSRIWMSTLCRTCLCCCLMAAVSCSDVALADDPGWPEIRIRLLPDESFAVVEQDNKGRRHRRCPHHDDNGELDIDQLVYVLGTLEEVAWISNALRKSAGEHLQRHYERYHSRALAATETARFPVDINRASLQELVLLPGIGPVLAVRIVRHREFNGHFSASEDIRKVEGIGQATFRAIRHYISCR